MRKRSEAGRPALVVATLALTLIAPNTTSAPAISFDASRSVLQHVELIGTLNVSPPFCYNANEPVPPGPPPYLAASHGWIHAPLPISKRTYLSRSTRQEARGSPRPSPLLTASWAAIPESSTSSWRVSRPQIR